MPTATASPTVTVQPTRTATATAVPTATAIPTLTPTLTPMPTKTATRAPTATASPQPPTPTAKATATATAQSRAQVVPPEIQRGDPAKKQIALTFDAGASAEPLSAILAALRQANVRSTFFLTGQWADKNPVQVKAIAAAGHELANHSMTHPDFTTLSDSDIMAELRTTQEIVEKLCGCRMLPYFRPPFGARNQRVLAAAWAAGFRSVYWTVDSGDWREDATVEGVVSTVLGKAVNGAIVVHHVGSPQTGEGLPRIIAGLRQRGFELVPLSTLLQ